MLQWYLTSIKNSMDLTIFVLIILIAIFEFFVDRPALKKQGYTKDAKVTAFVSIAWVVAAFALIITARVVK